ncbi:hypothetical protein HUG10_00850 [Halorarum halophilum]|uniref:DUF7975 domain-containing protein n=1 Tax=Halorarum halophilum TaxID=2743090 RepID=A0A7D5GXE6_9EURY|nr:hypothetical protein [Halobaculum halophilum]QLG26173.1 hypothetical protein HUG10_00850 [Halobaculum halophilum]
MTRFDADEPTDRRKLFADAVTAHRTRGSSFLTVEAREPEQAVQFGEDDGGEAGGTDGGDEEAEEDEPRAPPWIQFAEKTFNLDCTDGELERLNALLDEYPEFRIDEMESPEEADGTNVRISARSDANRLADFLERAFREVYEQPEGYRAWVVQV